MTEATSILELFVTGINFRLRNCQHISLLRKHRKKFMNFLSISIVFIICNTDLYEGEIS